MLLALSLTCLIGICCSARHRPIVLSQDPIRVEATLIRQERNFTYTFLITLSYRNDRYQFESEYCILGEDYEKAVSCLRKTNGWKNGYYFARNECSCGNAWRCVTEEVFAISNDKLVYLGQTSTHFGDPFMACCVSLEGSHFIDVFDQLENVSCHACSPDLKIVLDDVNCSFVVNVDLTWAENQDRFRKQMQVIKECREEHMRNYEVDANDALWFTAALAKFCGRDSTLNAIFSDAKQYYDKKQYGHFRSTIDAVPYAQDYSLPRSFK